MFPVFLEQDSEGLMPMTADDPQANERRLRRLTEIKAGILPEPEPTEAESGDAEDTTGNHGQRLENQSLWVDIQIRQAMRRGDFDNLPGTGKPIPGLDGGTHDPDWWLKNLIERERLTGVLPPALALRKEDAELQDLLDQQGSEEGVHRVLDDFNARVRDAQRQLQGGPPVITPLRDPDQEIGAWHERRRDRLERIRRQQRADANSGEQPSRWQRFTDRMFGTG